MNDKAPDLTPYTNLTNCTDDEILFFHKVIHIYFKINQEDLRKPFGWSQKEILLCHSRLCEIMHNRGLDHHSVDLIDDIDCHDNKKFKKGKDNKVYYSEEDLLNAIFKP